MKNVIIFAAAGGIAAAVGFAAGYYFGSKKWKKKLRDEAEALERTYKALAKPKQEPEEDKENEENEEGKGSGEEAELVDCGPIRSLDISSLVDNSAMYVDPDVSEEYNEAIKEYTDRPIIYNISEYEFEDDSNNYDKMEVVFFDEEEPHCIKSDTGEELIDWPVLLGFDEGCLCDEMFDSLQECYVRNTVSCIDFRVHRSSLEYID